MFKRLVSLFKSKIINPIKCTYMCLKYPFLYPRNRFTGLHYNNWKFHDYHVENYRKSVDYIYIRCFTKKTSGTRVLMMTATDSNDNVFSYKDTDKYIKLYINNKYISKIKKSDYDPILRFGFVKNKTTNNVEFGFICNNNIEKNQFKIITYITNRWLYMKVKIADFIHNYILQILHCIPTYTEWSVIEHGYVGWNKAFGKKLLKDIKKQLIKDKMLYSWRITDIKEKWGSLRIYCNYGSNDLYLILDKYEELSYHTCFDCGKSAKYLSGGYVLPYCDDCFNKEKYTVHAIDQNGNWKYYDN